MALHVKESETNVLSVTYEKSAVQKSDCTSMQRRKIPATKGDRLQ